MGEKQQVGSISPKMITSPMARKGASKLRPLQNSYTNLVKTSLATSENFDIAKIMNSKTPELNNVNSNIISKPTINEKDT